MSDTFDSDDFTDMTPPRHSSKMMLNPTPVGPNRTVQAELAERTRDLDYANKRAASHLNDTYKLRNELAAERERREAAEELLNKAGPHVLNKELRRRMYNHFARYKD